MTDLFKVTGPEGEPLHGGSGNWPLPAIDANGRRHVGKWRTVKQRLDICQVGLHLCDEVSLYGWLHKAPFTVWAADARGSFVDGGNKIAYESARLRRAVLVVTPEEAKEWERFRGRVAPADRLALATIIERWQAHRAESAEIAVKQELLRKERAKHDPLIAAEFGIPVTFGIHRLPADQRACKAWPDDRAWERAKVRASQSKILKSLGIKPSILAAVAKGIVPRDIIVQLAVLSAESR